VQGTIAETAPVVPISAQLKYNIDAVCEYIVKKASFPRRRSAQRAGAAPRRPPRVPRLRPARSVCARPPARESRLGHAMQHAGSL